MRNLSKKSKMIIAGAAIAGLASSGVAYAYWTTAGSGTGSATAGTSSPVVVNQTSDPDALYPGTSVALSGDFDNASTAAQYVTAVTATVDAFSIQPDVDKPACTDADFAITGPSTTPGDIPVGLGQGAWSGLSIQMLNRADTTPGDGTGNQDNCKDLTVADLTISYSAS